MAKTGYRFNPETLSYDRIHVSVKKKLWSLVVKFFSTPASAVRRLKGFPPSALPVPKAGGTDYIHNQNHPKSLFYPS